MTEWWFFFIYALAHTFCQGEPIKSEHGCSGALFSPHHIYSFAIGHDTAAKALKMLTCKIPPCQKSFLISVVPNVKGLFSGLNGFQLWVWIVQPKGNKEKSPALGDAVHSSY